MDTHLKHSETQNLSILPNYSRFSLGSFATHSHNHLTKYLEVLEILCVWLNYKWTLTWNTRKHTAYQYSLTIYKHSLSILPNRLLFVVIRVIQDTRRKTLGNPWKTWKALESIYIYVLVKKMNEGYSETHSLIVYTHTLSFSLIINIRNTHT